MICPASPAQESASIATPVASTSFSKITSTSLSPEALLDECQRIECQLGRPVNRTNEYTDRTVDIDIIFYDNQIINNERLTIPHKQFHKRAFMLVPMLEIADDFVHPFFGRTVESLYNDLENPEMVCLYGTRI